MAVQNGDRIQKVMSDMGVASRRKSEEYIKQGRVQVNGRKAEIGMSVNPKKDIIMLDGVRLDAAEGGKKYYLAMYKPRGYVTTMSDELGRKTIVDLLAELPVRVYPVGRLDKQSEGLLLLTNDGAFANMLTHPSHEVTKVYRVTVEGVASEEQLIQLAEGVIIDGKRTLPAQAKVITTGEGRTVIEMIIREGRNRQIRKMCEAVNLEVKRLRRTMIGPVKLSMLAPGEYRELTSAELSALRSMASKSQRKDAHEKAKETAKVARTQSRGAKPRREGAWRSDAKPRNEGTRYGEAKPRNEGTKYGESKPRSEGTRYSEKKPGGSGSRYGEAKPRNEGAKYGEPKPRSEGTRYSEKKPSNSGSRYGEAKPRNEGVKYNDSKPRRKTDGPRNK